jgi:hypothetical protein
MTPKQECDLDGLAQRVEALTGQETTAERWALEREIGYALGWKPQYGEREQAPPYFHCWDVAVALIPDGWEWTINNYDGRTTDYDGKPDNSRPWRCSMGSHIESDAYSGSAAICAAALRAVQS